MGSQERQGIEMTDDVFSSIQTMEQWYIKILDSINNGILVSDRELVVHYINAEYTRITGVAYDEIVGRTLTEVRPGAVLPQVIRTGKALMGVYRKAGDIEYVADVAPIMVNGVIAGAVSVVKDITEVRKLSQEIQKFTKKNNQLKNLVDRMYKAKYTFEDII
ncbi:MAG: modulated sigma54 specific transcriptional regulator, Fis family, partial [Firmicutes bacterium]|nr:modulated sigma54 specific transcriptional regulator, Fis family [Bacillota bacterium]